MTVQSWKEELDSKYELLTDSGDIKVIDRANEIICKALEELDDLRKENRWLEASTNTK